MDERRTGRRRRNDGRGHRVRRPREAGTTSRSPSRTPRARAQPGVRRARGAARAAIARPANESRWIDAIPSSVRRIDRNRGRPGTLRSQARRFRRARGGALASDALLATNTSSLRRRPISPTSCRIRSACSDCIFSIRPSDAAGRGRARRADKRRRRSSAPTSSPNASDKTAVIAADTPGLHRQSRRAAVLSPVAARLGTGRRLDRKSSTRSRVRPVFAWDRSS